VPLVAKTTPNVPMWNGYSRAHWEGDTLVVETKGFSGLTSFPNSSEKLQLVERFTRTDADTLIYRFTVTDPSTWTKPWTAEVPMTRSNEMMYEYACHEANYGMENLLKGARFLEKNGGSQTTSSRQ
jgi:meiotically up-regulated gene 157 (Mug157) protein